MTRKQFAKFLKKLKHGEEITITNGTWNFGIIKQEMFEVEQVFYGAYGGNAESMNTDHYDYDEIAKEIDLYMADYDNKETIIKECYIAE